MKKIIIALALTVVMLFAVSCGANKKVLVLQLPEGGSYNGSASVELDLSDKTETDENAVKTKELYIDGLTYTGEYRHTKISPFYECDTEVYHIDAANGFYCDCEISKTTGLATSYTFGYGNGYKTVSGAKTYEQCYETALSTAKRVCGNGEYVLLEDKSTKTPVNSPEHGDGYEFCFLRMIGEYKTNVVVTVGVNTDGWAYKIDSGANASYASIAAERWFMDRQKDVMDDINKKMKSLYKPSGKLVWIIEDSCFVKLKDGTLGSIYYINVHLEESGRTEPLVLFRPVEI